MAMRSRTAVPTALGLSFAVYLIPVIGSHGVWLWGGLLWGEFVVGRSEREPLWLLADAGFALAVQAAVFGLLLWLLRRPGWPAVLGLVAAVPVAPVAVNWGYQIAIPLRFLVEPARAAAKTDWPVACRVERAGVADLRSGASLALARAGEAWIYDTESLEYGLLTMPDCRVSARPIRLENAGGGLVEVAPGGAALYRTYEPESGAVSHWFLAADDTVPQRIRAPSDQRAWTPVLSADAAALAWIERRRDAAGNFSGSALVLLPLPEGTVRQVVLDVPANRSLRLIGAASARGPFVAEQNHRAVIGLDADGRVSTEPFTPPDLAASGETVRLLGSGWVAWDAYRETGRYRIAWSQPGGDGRIEIPKGRSITSVAVAPDGRLIAVSVTRSLSIGEIRDAVFVVDTVSGAELYRRYLPTYSRSRLAFLGERHLAVSRYENGNAWVEVLAVPED